MNVSHLEGIPYDFRTANCFDTVMAFFKEFSGVDLPRPVQPDKWWETQGLDLLMDNYEEWGFRAVDINPRDLKIGDCLLMAPSTPVASHCAVFIGQGKMLHHYYGRLSNVEVYKGIWRYTTLATIRHKTAVFADPVPVSVELLDLLSPQKREQLKDVVARLQPNPGSSA